MWFKHIVLSVYLFFSVAVSAEELTPAIDHHLYLSADQTELIKLDEDAASVIVANPEHANVLVDTPRHLVVIPRQPGATSFNVMNEAGDIILTKQVIIGAKKKSYVKIRRSCGASADAAACEALSYYYCPNGCHQVALAVPANGSTEAASAASTDSAALGSGPTPGSIGE